MPWAKGPRQDGVIQLNDSYNFRGTVLGVGSPGFPPARASVYYVDGKSGSDSNTGKSWEGAFATIAKFNTVARARVNWSDTPWARADICYIAPGTYAENLTTMTHGAMYIGMGHDIRDAQLGVKIKPASGSPINLDGLVNTAFFNIGFESADTSRAFDCTVLNNCYFDTCFFSGAAESVTCTEAFYTSDCVKTTFKNSWFCNAGYGMRFEYVDGGDSISYLLVEDCIISGVGTCGIYTSLNLVGPHSIVRRTDVYGGGQTLTTGVNDLSHILQLSGVNIEATTAIGASGAPRGVNFSYGNGTLLT